MNLYKFHTDPQSLLYGNSAPDQLPQLFWPKYRNNHEELKKRQGAIAKSREYSLKYALKYGPFPAGEPAIATDTNSAYEYAIDVLKGPFRMGEEAISQSAKFSF